LNSFLERNGSVASAPIADPNPDPAASAAAPAADPANAPGALGALGGSSSNAGVRTGFFVFKEALN
jgi:hypothetical protein